MSCIAGVFRLDGLPVERAPLERMAALLRPRAPHGSTLWHSGPVGLVHEYLRTGDTGAERRSALQLDGDVRMTADARLDGRDVLVSSLRASGRKVDHDAPHAELLVAAYHAFGDSFLDHVIGDFALALWDAGRQRLVCARDAFGVRPFYYFSSDRLVVFASQPDAVLAHPEVPRDLDNEAMAEFLMFGACLGPERTVYQHVRCLPRAQSMSIDAGGITRATHWTLPPTERIRFSDAREYVDGFTEHFEAAVKDRLPGGPVGVQLSGGMDSTSIAAVAALDSATSGTLPIAQHFSCLSLAPDDDETELAALVARHLGLPLLTTDVAARDLFARASGVQHRTPLPVGSGQLAMQRDAISALEARNAHVLLSGYAGDILFSAGANDTRALLRSGQWGALARDTWDHVCHTRSIRGAGLRAMLKAPPLPDPDWKPQRPGWIANIPDAVLDGRWMEWWQRYAGAASARDQFALPWFSRPFEEAACLPATVAHRYPFLDVRLVRYLLALPPFMLQGKRVMREAMRARLPGRIVDRPKAVVPVDVPRRLVTNGRIDEMPAQFAGVIDADRFTTAWEAYSRSAENRSTWVSALIVLPIALSHWMIAQRSAFDEA